MSKHLLRDGIVLQARDFALLGDLLDSRLMTIKHAAGLHFDGRIEAAKKRLQKLRTAGTIVQRSRRPQEPAVYSLGRLGYLRLKQEGMLNAASDVGWAKVWKRQQIGDLLLRHELSAMDVRTAFVKAIAEDPHLELVEISTSPEKHKFRVIEAVPVSNGQVRFRSLFAKPDGFIQIRERHEAGGSTDHFFFLEVDMGTEALGRLVQKLRQYSQHYRKGAFATRHGHRREDFRRFPFRVLIIFSSEERCGNLARKLTEVTTPLKGQALLATLGQVVEEPLGRIWSRPMKTEPRRAQKLLG